MHNKILKLSLILTVSILISGCGNRIASISTLKNIAKKHGSYELIEQKSDKNRNSITVYDKQYGVTYTIKSYMQSTGLDGTTFHRHATVDDTYASAIALQYLDMYEDKLDEYCNSNNCYYEINASAHSIALYIKDTKNAKDIAKGFFDVLQDINYDNKIDGLEIFVYSKDTLNRITLPNFTWQTADEKILKGFSDLAKRYDRNAKFLRQETKTFAETGLSTDELYDCPQRTGKALPNPNDTVDYYYFKINGKEHFICDIKIHDPDYGYWMYSDCGPLWKWNQ